MAVFDSLQGFVDQSDYVAYIVNMGHFHGSVHISQGQGDQGRGNTTIGIGEGIGIGAGSSAGGLSLERNVVGFCASDDQVDQFLMDSGGVGKGGPLTAANIAVFFLIDERCSGVVSDIGDDGHVGLNGLSDHFCPAQTDFFLDGVYDVQGEGEFYLVLFEESCDFGDAEASHSIVKCSAAVVAVIDFGEFILEGNDASYVDTHFQDFLFVFCTDVYGYIFEVRCQVGILIGSGVDSGPAEYTWDSIPVAQVYIYPHRGGYYVVGSTITNHMNEAILGDVINEPGNFIGVAFDYDIKAGSRIDDSVCGTIIINFPLIYVGLEVFQPDFLATSFMAGGAMVI